MCEKRNRKIKKGSHVTRLREARRLERLQRMSSPAASEEPAAPCRPAPCRPAPCQPAQVNKVAQNRVILELAWRTIALMHKNRLIQQKIVALQKETSEFIASVMSNPENRRRYIEHVRLYGVPRQLQFQIQTFKNKIPVKVESNV